MATITLTRGTRYRATIKLGMFEQFASNEQVAERLAGAGFSDVTVTGSGSDRTAEAVWDQPTTTADLPSQVESVWAVQ